MGRGFPRRPGRSSCTRVRAGSHSRIERPPSQIGTRGRRLSCVESRVIGRHFQVCAAVAGSAAEDLPVPFAVGLADQGPARHGVRVRREVHHVEVLRVQAGEAGVVNFSGAQIRSGEGERVVMPLLPVPAGVAVPVVVGVAIHLDGVDGVGMPRFVQVQVDGPGHVVRDRPRRLSSVPPERPGPRPACGPGCRRSDTPPRRGGTRGRCWPAGIRAGALRW